MKVLVVEPYKLPVVKEIKGDLESMQRIVGKAVKTMYPFEDLAVLVCNRNGKGAGLPYNRMLPEIQDAVAGTFFICGILGNEFVSLTEHQITHYGDRFFYPQEILPVINGYLVHDLPEEIKEEPKVTYKNPRVNRASQNQDAYHRKGRL